MFWRRLSLAGVYVLGLALVMLGLWRLSLGSTPMFGVILLLWEIVMGLLAIGGFVAVIRKRMKTRTFWELLFLASVFLGVWFLCLLVFPFGWGLGVALVFMGLPFLFPRIGFSNLFFLIGSAGISFYFARLVSADGLLILYLGLTLIDLFAYGSMGFVSELTEMLAPRGLTPGFVLVDHPSDWKRPVKDLLQHSFETIGATELILPLALFVRAAVTDWKNGVWLGTGLLLGLFIHLGYKQRYVRQSVPWVALGVIVPFLVLRLLGHVV